MSSRTASNVVVIEGGPRAERERARVRGRDRAAALQEAGNEMVGTDAGSAMPARPAAHAPDAPIESPVESPRGRRGADGRVQGLLEWLHIPYTHSGVLSPIPAAPAGIALSGLPMGAAPIEEGFACSR